MSLLIKIRELFGQIRQPFRDPRPSTGVAIRRSGWALLLLPALGWANEMLSREVYICRQFEPALTRPGKRVLEIVEWEDGFQAYFLDGQAEERLRSGSWGVLPARRQPSKPGEMLFVQHTNQGVVRSDCERAFGGN
jgi:hypothetical protein